MLELDVQAASEAYFANETWHCADCGHDLSLWSILVGTVSENFGMGWAYCAIGATQTAFQFQLAPRKTQPLVFAEFGVPESATILCINYTPYTPQGSLGCFPIEIHSNTPSWRPPKTDVTVYGHGNPDVTAPTTIHCLLTWIFPPDEDDGWRHLIDAFRAYCSDNRQGAIIPANIAAEAAISKAAFEGLRAAKLAKADVIEQFLSDSGAGYSSQVRFILPLLAKVYGYAQMPQELAGKLLRLRTLRNQLAHSGRTKEPFNPDEVPELLAAATLGFHYGRALRGHIPKPE
jgi:hypothetical protein